ncbi:hypothetical protein BDV38DRAFT_281834 [Aspergillus pseudotamarii]|uniref:AB hydrolase-1 domain-containing protein n=1 Tax=Aspergillus pseudotamarii TaxID=132259 RepID=A0A5N6SV56_ASPPS|nr:uncharacterized protein BDV38DRAFT_281834 [Aspergillus pseudotamarii]KAE8138525.1 hypothetical protein BDV38DRAFT_281834 [Aspergillus pseudotamarii]
MQPFDLQLPDGNNLAGRVYSPQQTSNVRRYMLLLICVHGGGYDVEYFEIDSQHSVARDARASTVPVISLSRPSYGGRTPLATIADGRSSGEQQRQYLNTTILPAL